MTPFLSLFSLPTSMFILFCVFDFGLVVFKVVVFNSVPPCLQSRLGRATIQSVPVRSVMVPFAM